MSTSTSEPFSSVKDVFNVLLFLNSDTHTPLKYIALRRYIRSSALVLSITFSIKPFVLSEAHLLISTAALSSLKLTEATFELKNSTFTFRKSLFTGIFLLVHMEFAIESFVEGSVASKAYLSFL